MDRSVSIELPDMPAGRYSVFISVSAERDARTPSVEDVVKRECKARGENEKLAQVGQAYDLANSKAANHLAELAKVRKIKAQSKASESRMKERRKLWERRHLTRDIQKRQKEKNEEKGKKLKEDKTARRAKEEEEEAAKKMAEEAEEAEAKAEKKAAEEAAAALPKKEVKEKAAQKKREEEEEATAKDEAGQAGQNDEANVSKTQGEYNTVRAETPEEDDKSWCASGFTTGANSPSESPVATPQDEEARDLASEEKVEEKSEVKPEIKAEVQVEAKSDEVIEDKPKDKVEGKTEEKSEKTDTSTTPKTTPKSKATEGGTEMSSDEESQDEAEDAPAEEAAPPPAVKDDSDSYSSDSPVEDWEELYSSDDLSEKPRTATPVPAATATQSAEDDTDDEKDPLPWNAICVVGFRVYSKDEDLELRVVMEGGQLLQDGMCAWGEEGLDNAQANAGGTRVDTEAGATVQ